MTSQSAERETTLGTDDVRHLGSLAAALRAIGIANQLHLHYQRLVVTRSGQQPLEIDFSGRVPFGFVFTAGYDATFKVPCGYRFWIDHISLSLPALHDTLDVQLVTRSQHSFQQVSLRYGADPSSDGDVPEVGAAPPILLPESTASTLLFSNGMEYGLSIVPKGAYVQLWGCLEPVDAPAKE